MILFDQLRVSDDGSKLYINAHVNTASYFDGITIKQLVVTTSDKALETSSGVPTDYIYKETFDEGTKEIALVISVTDCIRRWETNIKEMNFTLADMGKTLFFVYIECQGQVGECTPCTLDELVTLGVTFDENLLYQKVMNYTKELAQDCTVHQGFIDFILQWNAFKAAVETEHYIDANDYFHLLFDETSGIQKVSPKNCGCHG